MFQMNNMQGSSEDTPLQSQAKTKKRFLGTFAIVLIVFLIVAAVIGLILNLTKSNPSEISDDKPWRNYRLSNTTVPQHYDLTVQPDIIGGLFNGSVAIELQVSQPTNAIYLHIFAVNVTDTQITDDSSNPIALRDTFAYPENEYWVVRTEKALQNGTYWLRLTFVGTLTNGIVGFYRSSYTESNGKKKYLATTKFEPTYARRAFPCFDEPNKKATYKIHVIHESAYRTVLSNQEIESTVNWQNNLVKTTFSKTVRMSTYLVCFIISEFDYLKSEAANVTIRTYASPDRVNSTRFALQVATKVLAAYDHYFQIPYSMSFPKLDLVAVPDFVSGAMENWGLITFREVQFLFNPKTATASNQYSIAETVSHELAHMWFGNLVTMDWWDDLWLNEGFATFIAYVVGMEAAHPEYDPESGFLNRELQSTMKLDARLSTHPIIVPVAHPDDINAAFDTITYGKGSSVLRMLENYLGANDFQRGIRKYLQKYTYSNARTNDLWNVLSEVTGKDVKSLMDSWTKQSGFPVVSYNSTTEIVSQKIFLSNPNDEAQSHLWNIPISYKINNTTKSFLLNTSSQPLKFDNGALPKLNTDQKGFYRVNYDEAEWKTLTSTLYSNINAYSSMDRAQLVDDAFQLASAKQLDYTIPLDMIQYLKAEVNSTVPWGAAGSNIGYITAMLRSYNKTAHDKLKKLTKQLGLNVLQVIGWNATNELFQRKLLRPIIINFACMTTSNESSNDCTDKAYDLFNRWIDDENYIISSDYFGQVVTVGMAQPNLTNATWTTVWKRYLTAGPVEKDLLSSALASPTDIAYLERYLNLAQDKSYVRDQNYVGVMTSLAANPLFTDRVYSFVKDNWTKLVQRFSLNDRSFGRLLTYVTQRYNTPEKLSDLKTFFAKYPDAGAGENPRKLALASISQNIAWVKTNGDYVTKWILDQ